MSETVNVSMKAMGRLRELARWQGLSLEAALEAAIKGDYDAKFWEYVEKGYAAMRTDPEVWAEVERERREFDGTLMDGLDKNERWTEDGRVEHSSDMEEAS